MLPVWIRRVAALALCLAALAPSALAQKTSKRALELGSSGVDALPAQSKRYALVVGVNDYQDSLLSRLSGAANDARSLADAIVQYAGFPKDNVVLLTTDQPVTNQPTRSNILGKLSTLRQLVPEDGLLLLFFAGHGIERDGQAYLLTMDTQINGDISLLEDSSLSVRVLSDRIRATGVKQVVLILDACRNNPLAGRGASASSLSTAYVRPFDFEGHNRDITAFVTLYATGIGQTAFEYRDRQQGYFTRALVEGLKGEAANERGEVTLEGLLTFVEETVPKRIKLDLGAASVQQPWSTIEGFKASSLVIAAPAPGAVARAAEAPTAPPPPAPDRGDARQAPPPAKPAKDLGGDPITGAWACVYGPGRFPFEFSLQLQNGKVTGRCVLDGVVSTISDGEWTGSALTIRVVHRGSRIRFVASFESGMLVGKEFVDGSTTPLDWSASKK